KTSPEILSGTASDTGLSGLPSISWTNAATSGSGAASGTTSWTGSVPLTPGANFITFTATDGAGNTGFDTITVTYDVSNPSIAITAPSATGTYQTPSGTIAVGVLSGTASDNIALSNVQYQVNGGGFITATGTTSWS